MSFSANPFGALDDDAAPAPAAGKKPTGDAKPVAKGACFIGIANTRARTSARPLERSCARDVR